MELLKVPTGSVPLYPEMTELEAHQLIDRQQLLETMKKTHTERHFGPITELPWPEWTEDAATTGRDYCNQCLLAHCLARGAIWDSSSPDITGSSVSWTEGERPVLLKD